MPLEIMIADTTHYNVEAPNPRSLTLENIAIALSNTCRWGGHLGEAEIRNKNVYTHKTVEPFTILKPAYYSVAEHCVLGAKYYLHKEDPLRAKLFLLHDALEPFIGGDIPTPLKDHLPKLCLWETNGQRVLLDAYGLQDHSFDMIAEVDKRICRNEVIKLYDDAPLWSKNIEPLYYEKSWDRKLLRLEMWDNTRAANEWHRLAKQLGLENKYVT